MLRKKEDVPEGGYCQTGKGIGKNVLSLLGREIVNTGNMGIGNKCS